MNVTISVTVTDEHGVVVQSAARHVSVERRGPSIAVRDDVEEAVLDALGNAMDGAHL